MELPSSTYIKTREIKLDATLCIRKDQYKKIKTNDFHNAINATTIHS